MRHTWTHTSVSSLLFFSWKHWTPPPLAPGSIKLPGEGLCSPRAVNVLRAMASYPHTHPHTNAHTHMGWMVQKGTPYLIPWFILQKTFLFLSFFVPPLSSSLHVFEELRVSEKLWCLMTPSFSGTESISSGHSQTRAPTQPLRVEVFYVPSVFAQKVCTSASNYTHTHTHTPLSRTDVQALLVVVSSCTPWISETPVVTLVQSYHHTTSGSPAGSLHRGQLFFIYSFVFVGWGWGCLII